VPRTVAVVGASADRRKFGNKSVRAHALRGYQVFPIHPTESEVEGLPVYRSVADVPVERLDRVTIYLPAAKALPVLAEIARKPAGEVWLNPGADDPEVVAQARALGMNVITGCSIVDVGVSPYDL
jgi:predicted CoA-binding protein